MTSSLKKYLVPAAVVVAAVAVVVFAGTYLSEESSLQRRADTSVDEILSRGGKLSPGLYVSLDAKRVLGPYADGKRSYDGGVSFTMPGTAYYYFAFLDDGTVLTIETESTREKEALDRMSNAAVEARGFTEGGETLRVQGTLKDMKAMTDYADLLGIYRDILENEFGIDLKDPAATTLILDTSTGRDALQWFLVGVIAAAGIATAVLIVRRTRAARVPHL